MYGQKDKEKAVHKAVVADASAPKRKHVRKIIVDSWQYGKINVLHELAKEPMLEKGVVAFKAFTVIHKLLQEGAPRVLQRAYAWLPFVARVEHHWARCGEQQYGPLVAAYGHFLRSKITFHHKHPLIIGSLALDDYKKKIQNQPEVPLQYRLQMLSHLLDLQDSIVSAQGAVFRQRRQDLSEAKVACLVPLVVECDAVYQIIVHHMYLICDRIEHLDKFGGLLERFNLQYDSVRVFYDNARSIKYVNDLISVPFLPADSQSFEAVGAKKHLVPDDEGPIKVLPLMDVEKYISDNATAPPPENPDARPASTSYDRGVTAEQLAQLERQEQERKEQERKQAELKAEQERRLAEQQRQQAIEQQQREQAMAMGMQQMTPEQQARHAQLVSEAARMSPEEVATHVMKLQTDQMMGMQWNHQLQAQLMGAHQRIMELERILMERDAEILHWKQQYQQVALERDRISNMLGEESRRANELEDQLMELNQKWSDEKKRHLEKKLSLALQILRDDVTADPGASPDSVLALCNQLDEHVAAVKSGATAHDTEALAEEISKLSSTAHRQNEGAVGVAKFLTDDAALQGDIRQANGNAAEAAERIVNVVASDPHDTEIIMEACDAALALNEQLREAMLRVKRAEECDGDAMTEKAGQELRMAASVIEKATQQLLEAKARADRELEERRKNPGSGSGIDVNVSSAILEATMAITQATANLMDQAQTMQSETAARTSAHGGKAYKKDLVWNEGLVTAAKDVAATVSELVRKANDTVNAEELEEEHLIATSKAVSAATSKLVLASRVRASPNSDTQRQLEKASSSVTRGTRNLVHAAQAASSAAQLLKEEAEDAELIGNHSLTAAKIREVEQQAAILKLERDLETARRRLNRMREASYANK